MIEELPPFPAGATALFIGVVALAGVAVSWGTYGTAARLGYPRIGSRRLAFDVTAALVLWLGLTAFLGWRGLLRDFESLPPRIFLVIAPALGAVIYLLASRMMRDFQLAVPLVWLTALQTFRLPLELVLYQLADAGVTPRIMTFEGRNFDILIGITAPFVAWALATGRPWARRTATWWNVIGLILLINVAGTGMLSAPTRFQAFDVEPANSFVAHFPFVWLVTFLVPLALYLHVNSLRCLQYQRNQSA